ncbi:tRNA-binding protein [Alkalicaulis satelles]|uniref:tRNA-binding protein n=1 Tax=Alkalicaulis satelles TaxID=2609175 RepID=A0A5M6ZJW2_9PROT|nr:tRNA-binding protein [Alkalicaulis satelles]KAA5805103.1 tRNA-binding protein [Alkalicaulis satelles]
MDPDAPALPEITPDDFFRADIRLGEILTADPFPEARKPAWKLTIDFGPGVGVKTSSAQITEHYAREDLPGRRVLAVVNFPPRQIGPVRSQVLVLGVHDEQGHVRLIGVDGPAPLGARLS